MYRHRHRRSGKRYDVFVSFRGKNTRDTFISQLGNYLSMSNPPIYAFFDTRIEGGDDIERELEQSMKNSKMYVIVFSKNFPESKWCLWELVEIVAATPEKKILPIFYGVTRDDVRLITHLYTDQLSLHCNATESDMKRWTEGFKYVAEIEGLEWAPESPDELGDDADLCQQTLERVTEMIGIKELQQQPVNLQINLRSLPNLTNLEGLDTLPASNYKSLVIEDCKILQNLISQSGLKNIQQLTIRDCDGLKDISHLGQDLKVLQIENCRHLVTLPDLSNLTELEQLFIINCPELIQVVGLSMLVSLQQMYIGNCKSLIHVDINVSKVGKVLQYLTVGGCDNLSSLGNPDWDDNDHEHPSSSDEECSNRTTTSFTALTLCASDHHDAGKVGITGLPVSCEVSASSTEQEISEQLNSWISINDGENSHCQCNASKVEEPCGAKEAGWDILRKFISGPEGSVDRSSLAAAIKIVLPENVTTKGTGTIQNPSSSEFDGGGPSGAKEVIETELYSVSIIGKEEHQK